MDGSMTKLRDWIAGSGNIVFFGGAGVSTESGIPDFRSVDGLYSQRYEFPPETILSYSFFRKNPEVFFRFYREKILIDGAQPNAAHRALAGLEAGGGLRGVITQNIDGLHQAAGSRNALELHGGVDRNYCIRCKREYDRAYVKERGGVPRCVCGGIVRPDVVLYEEHLDEDVLRRAVALVRDAQLLIVGGTSLAVYPAAGLIDCYRGDKLVLINRDETPYDDRADLILRAPIGRVFTELGLDNPPFSDMDKGIQM